MKKEDLLESRTRQDLAFIQYLYTHNGHALRKQMATDLQVDPRLITDHMAALGDQLNTLFPNAPFHLGPSETEYILDLVNLPTLEDITNLLIRDGYSFQILAYIFWHNEFTMSGLQRALLMSSSTLFRHVSRLNTLLAEFNIAIRNNRLIGRELDIRHFYYQLFIVLNGHDPRLSDTSNRAIERFITLFQQRITGPLDENIQQAIRVYLHIVLQRVASNHPLNDSVGVFKLNTLIKLPKVREMQQIWEEMFGRNHHIAIEFESVAFFVYTFYARILPLKSDLYRQLYLGTSSFSIKMRGYVHTVMDILSSKFEMHSYHEEFQLIFFTELTTIALLPGVITTAHQLIYTAMQGVYWKPESGQMRFIRYIIAQLQKNSEDFSQSGAVDELEERLLMTVLLLLRHTHRQFQIGLLTSNDLPINFYLLRALREQIGANFNIHIENFDRHHQYDIILTTSMELAAQLGLKNDLPLIQLQDFGTSSDFVVLYWYLDTLVSNYLKTDLVLS